jgi:hypothetical protein
MKKRLLYLFVVLISIISYGCKEYDDTEVWDSINSLEQRMSAMETVMNAYKNNLLIKSVDETDNGYVITFTDGSSTTISNGKDGRDGVDGKDGKDGVDGKDGENGKDGKDGVDGKDGENGKDGKDGVDGKDGENGKDGKDGVDGKDGDTLIESIVIYENYVTFNLTDGRSFSISLYSSLTVDFDSEDLLAMSPNSERDIHYTVHSLIKDIKVEVLSSADIKAKVVPDSETDSTGAIHIITGSSIDEYSKVVVLATNGEKMLMRTITFEEAGLVISNGAIKKVPPIGGDTKLEFLTNVECKVVIPDSVKSWISIAPDTRAMHKDTITLSVSANDGYNRSAIVMVQSTDDALSAVYTIDQKGELGENIPNEVPADEIWYVSSNGEEKNYSSSDFDVNIKSQTFKNGKWIIKFSGPVKSASLGYGLKELYLPDNIEVLNLPSFDCDIKTLRIPANLKSFGPNHWDWLSLNYIDSFTGPHVSEDGRCVIVNGVLLAIADKGLREYTFPDGIKSIDKAFFYENDEIEKVTFSEGLTEIPDRFFYNCKNLKYVYFPSTLLDLDDEVFEGCPSLEGLYGSEEFITSDHHCMIDKYDDKTRLTLFAGHGMTDYTIPEGIQDIWGYAFYGTGDELRRITFPSTLKSLGFWGGNPFSHTPNLEAAYGPYISEDHRCFVRDSLLIAFIAQKDVSSYRISDNIIYIGNWSFSNMDCVETITMGDQVRGIYNRAFENCDKLESITLSARLKEVEYPFQGDISLCKVYLRSPFPPYLKNIEDLDNAEVYVPRQTLHLYKNARSWLLWKDYMVGYDYDGIDKFIPDCYISSDFSKDGEVTTLQRASEGNGIDVILIGDGYSDRQIESGEYQEDINLYYDAFFSVEPFKTFKNLFNVYSIAAVSLTEGYDYGYTAINADVSELKLGLTYISGDNETCKSYAQEAISSDRMDNALIIVTMNIDEYGGTTHMSYPSSKEKDYGEGLAIAYCPFLNSNSSKYDGLNYSNILIHEACGHGFGKLADEYSVISTIPRISDNEIINMREDQEIGWWKNVDFTDDLDKILWSKFIKDSRYTNDGLGAYEGGATFSLGVWRSTENSYMRYNTGGFNAPSREAIYYRIHKLAYGDSWQYNYEDFVEYDEINIKKASTSIAPMSVPANFVPLHPPIIVKE